MDRAERATPDTSILFHLGVVSAIKGSARRKDDGESLLCSELRRGTKSGSGVENRGGGGAGGCSSSSDEDMTLAGYLE